MRDVTSSATHPPMVPLAQVSPNPRLPPNSLCLPAEGTFHLEPAVIWVAVSEGRAVSAMLATVPQHTVGAEEATVE